YQGLVRDLATGKTLSVLNDHSENIVRTIFSNDGTKLATAALGLPPGVQNNLAIWDAETGARIRVLKGHVDGIEALAFSPDGKRLFAASLDKVARLWEIDSGTEVFSF